MSRVVPSSMQKEAAEKTASAISRIKGSEAEVVERSSGTSPRWTISVKCNPENWRGLVEKLHSTHQVDYCSMITDSLLRRAFREEVGSSVPLSPNRVKNPRNRWSSTNDNYRSYLSERQYDSR